MTPRKPRKTLTDSLEPEFDSEAEKLKATTFVYGASEPKTEPLPTEVKSELKPQNEQPPPSSPPRISFMSQLLEKAAEKEATVRLTVDLPESMHRKLSILCAKTGKKKADIVRMLLAEVLDQPSE